MKMSVNELNRGIVCFLGFGVDKFPHAHKAELIAEFGIDKAQVVEREVVALINEANQIPIDWEVHSLSSAGGVVMERLKESHPKLSEPALCAIAWKVTFDWR